MHEGPLELMPMQEVPRPRVDADAQGAPGAAADARGALGAGARGAPVVGTRDAPAQEGGLGMSSSSSVKTQELW
jgi:hypothetical protein